jgi:hypothetical protein
VVSIFTTLGDFLKSSLSSFVTHSTATNKS